MKFLIVALLALAVDATHHGWSNYYGGSPSYSYSSYPSSYHGGYGSSLYGVSYGLGGSSYGLGGSTYGIGSGYGLGGGHSYYTTAQRPVAYQTARYSYKQPYNTGAYKSGYHSNAAPGSISFTLGGTGYQTNLPGESSYARWKSPVAVGPAKIFNQGAAIHGSGIHGEGALGKTSFTRDFSKISGLPSPVGVSAISAQRKTVVPTTVITEKHFDQQPHNLKTVYKSGYSSNATPGRIAFTLGGTGYQTGISGVSGYRKWNSPIAVGGHGINADVPGIHVQEVAGVKGAGPELSGVGGHISGVDFIGAGHGKISSPVAVPQIKPAVVLSHKTSNVHHGIVQGITGGVAPGKISFTQDFSQVSHQPGHHKSGQNIGISTFKKTIAPPRVLTERRPYGVGSTHRSGGSIGAITGQPQHITFTQDFSKVIGQSGITAIKPEIHRYDRVIPPVRAAVAPKIPARRYGGSGTIRQSGFLGTTGGHPQIRFTQGTPKVFGQSHIQGIKPEITHFDKFSGPFVRTVAQHPVSHGASYLQRTDRHGISGISKQEEITFVQDVIGHSGFHDGHVKPAVVTVDKFARGVPALPKPSYEHRNVGTFSKNAIQGVSAAGPARISFIQDFSKVSGHQISGLKPIVTSHEKSTISAFPGVVSTGGYQTRPKSTFSVSKPAPKIEFKAPKQPVRQEPTLTGIYQQSHTGEGSSGHISDKSAFVTGPVTGFGGDHIVDQKQEIVVVDDVSKQSGIFQAPVTGISHDKSLTHKHSSANAAFGGQGNFGELTSYKVSSAGQTGDKSNIFVAVPADGYTGDKSSTLLHSSGIQSTGTFVENKGSIFPVSLGNVEGKSGYSAISAPFKSYYSSSYPGYSHVSGESPRFDFSSDRSLLYTYDSPYIVSPFSYAYSSGKDHYESLYKKA